MHYFDHGRIGEYIPDGPLILGHEASGVIAAVGDGVAADRSVSGSPLNRSDHADAASSASRVGIICAPTSSSWARLPTTALH